MNRCLFLVALAAIAVPAAADAQIGSYVRPRTQLHPTVSPYINLRSGNPVNSYFGVVRPELQASQDLSALNQQFQQLQGQGYGQGPYGPGGEAVVTPIIGSGIPPFFYYGSYYPQYPGVPSYVAPALRGAGH